MVADWCLSTPHLRANPWSQISKIGSSPFLTSTKSLGIRTDPPWTEEVGIIILPGGLKILEELVNSAGIELVKKLRDITAAQCLI